MSMNNVAGGRVARQPDAGGPLGISQAFLKYQSALKRYINRFIRQPQDIEDIVHEAYLRSYVAEITTRIKSPKSFLFKTARNLALNHIDRCANRLVDHVQDLETLQALVDERSAERRASGEEQFLLFCRAVRNLPPRCRKAFILRKVYGLSHREIAEAQNISVSTVEKHLATGLAKCHEYMRTSAAVGDTEVAAAQGKR